MQNDIKLLDCTLRDGGYLVDCQFGDKFIRGFTQSLTDAGVDVIEVGFLKDEPHQPGSTIFNNASQIIPYMPARRKKGTCYVALSDFSRYSIEKLEPCDGKSINGVRACFFKHERKAVLPFCRRIRELGYQLYVQPVDILGYTEEELLDLIEDINELHPLTLSCVDTFGSMFTEDLERLFVIIHTHLDPSIRMGFHSHNNMQMSFALTQEFVRLADGLRNITVDATLCGMGRGAGNTNTELVADYLNRKWKKHYDLDTLLDAVDNYMGSMRARCTWGYSVPYFLAGIYSAHVHNITYLSEKPSIRSKDMRYVLEQLSPTVRKRYDYDLVDKIYAGCLASTGDDTESRDAFARLVKGRTVLICLPGPSSKTCAPQIEAFRKETGAFVIQVNQLPPNGKPLPDLAFFSNPKRYDYWKNSDRFSLVPQLLTSNLAQEAAEGRLVVNIASLMRPGFRYADNAAILLLTLLDSCAPHRVVIAGFDGYDTDARNFATEDMERRYDAEQAASINEGLSAVLTDLKDHHKGVLPEFLTPSRFEKIFREVTE